jgi:thioredoxin 1
MSNPASLCKTTVWIASLCMLMLNACNNHPNTKQPSKSLPKLMDLGAHACIPCQKMAPILDELSKSYAGVFEVEFIDVWQAENKKKADFHQIRSIPTQIFFNAEGQELWRHEGFLSKEAILAKWTELGFNPNLATPESDCCP